MLPPTYLLCNVPIFPSDQKHGIGRRESWSATKWYLDIDIWCNKDWACAVSFDNTDTVHVLPVLLQLLHTCTSRFAATATYLQSLLSYYCYILVLPVLLLWLHSSLDVYWNLLVPFPDEYRWQVLPHVGEWMVTSTRWWSNHLMKWELTLMKCSHRFFKSLILLDNLRKWSHRFEM
jgi:hypothetical protein